MLCVVGAINGAYEIYSKQTIEYGELGERYLYKAIKWPECDLKETGIHLVFYV